MVRRIMNRRELREQADHAGRSEAVPAESVSVAEAPKEKAKAKAAATPKVRKPRKVKAPPRLRARWGVFDGTMKQVAIFDYNARAAADEKLASLLATKKGLHFMQIVKELMPEPAPAEAPAVE